MKIALAAALCLSTAAVAADRVDGHFRRDGTYVAPHYRTSPNETKLDNYSTQGNYNPYTGQTGSRNVDSNPYNAPRQPTYTQPSYTPPPAYNPSQTAPNPYSNPYRR